MVEEPKYGMNADMLRIAHTGCGHCLAGLWRRKAKTTPRRLVRQVPMHYVLREDASWKSSKSFVDGFSKLFGDLLKGFRRF